MTHGSKRRRARKRGGGVLGESEMCEEGERDWEKERYEQKGEEEVRNSLSWWWNVNKYIYSSTISMYFT